MKHLLLSLTLIISANAWAEKVYLNCEGVETAFSEKIFFLDLEKKTYEEYDNPSVLLRYSESVRHTLSDSPYTLTVENGVLREITLTSIALGVICTIFCDNEGDFLSIMTIDRKKLTLRYLAKTAQCKLIEKYDYQETVKEWQALLDKEKEAIKSKRKF